MIKLNDTNLFHIHWWGYAQGGCRQRCGPAAAAGRSSGASGLLHGHPWCSQGPCSSLQAQHMVNISLQTQLVSWEKRFCASNVILTAKRSTKPVLWLKVLTTNKSKNINNVEMMMMRWDMGKGNYLPFNSAEDQSWTDMSGILLASCMAGTTMLLLS